MKNLFQTLVFLFVSFATFAQAPQGFKYQAAARYTDNTPMASRDLGIRATILMGGQAGNVVYSERHTPTTNDLGVFHINIGEGNTISGDFSAIEWGSEDFFLKIDMDDEGGTQYQNIGVTQLLSVPYAMYATKAGSVDGDNDLSNTNELQELAINGNQLSLSGNNSTVTLPSAPTYAAGSGININGSTISAADASATNELQELAINGNQLSLSGNNSTVTLPSAPTYAAGNGININGSTISAADASATNEIQELSLSGSDLNLSNGGGSVSLSAFTPVWAKAGSNAYYLNNVGVGTSSASEKLTITGAENTGATASLSISSGGQKMLIDGNEIDATVDGLFLNNNSNGNVILANGGGNVGIGTSTASSKLHISANSGGTLHQLELRETEASDFSRLKMASSTSHFWTLAARSNSTLAENEFNIYHSHGGNIISIQPKISGGSGYVGINTTTNATYDLMVNGTAAKPGGGSWTASSDRRLKTDVKDFNTGLDLVQKVHAVSYRYNGKLGLPTEPEYIGVIAQELQAVAPFMVTEFKGEDGVTYLAVDPSAFDYILINAVKEQQQTIEAQQKELADLKAIVEKLVSATASK